MPAPTPPDIRLQYLALRLTGHSRTSAAKAVDISYSTATRLDQRANPIERLLLKRPSS